MLEIDQVDRAVQALSARMYLIEGKIKKYILKHKLFPFFKEYKKDPEPIVRKGLPLLNSPEIVIQKYSVITPRTTTIYKEEYVFYRNYNNTHYMHYKGPFNFTQLKESALGSFLGNYIDEPELKITKYLLVKVLSSGEDKPDTDKSINNFINWLKENNYEIPYYDAHPSLIDDFVDIYIPVRTLQFFNLF